MYKIKQIIFKHINLPYNILHYISSFLTKDDIIYENNFINSYFVKLKLRQRHRNKILH